MPKQAPHKPAVEMIALDLTPAERVILPQLFRLDKELEERLGNDKDRRPLSLALEEWGVIAAGIAAKADHTASRKRRRLLEGLLAKIENLLTEYLSAEPGHDEDNVIDLTAYGPPGPRVEAEAMAYLHDFMDDLLATCSATGIDVEKLLESFSPVRVEPEDRIGVRLNGKQRALLMDLPQTPETIKVAIRETSPRKHKVELTLSQVHTLENTLARLLQDTSGPKLQRALQRIDGELMNIQVHYTDGNDDPPSALQLAACPDSLSRGALVRQLLTQMLQARLPDTKRRGQR